MAEQTLKEKTAKGLFWGGLSNGVQQVLNLSLIHIFHRILAHIELQHIFHKVLFLHGYRVQADILSDKMLELIR